MMSFMFLLVKLGQNRVFEDKAIHKQSLGQIPLWLVGAVQNALCHVCMEI